MPLTLGLALGGIATLSRSRSAWVGPVKFWNPGIEPGRDPREEDRQQVGAVGLVALKAARFGNTPGYRIGSSLPSSGRATYLAKSSSWLGGLRFHSSLRPIGTMTSLNNGFPSRDTWVNGPTW